jgi:hypothetical protein
MSLQSDDRVPHPPGFPVKLGGVSELHAAFLIESRTRNYVWGRAVGNPGSFAILRRVGSTDVTVSPLLYGAPFHSAGTLIRALVDPTLRKKARRVGHPLAVLDDRNFRVRFFHTFSSVCGEKLHLAAQPSIHQKQRPCQIFDRLVISTPARAQILPTVCKYALMPVDIICTPMQSRMKEDRRITIDVPDLPRSRSAFLAYR